jgi:hypothetical protein
MITIKAVKSMPNNFLKVACDIFWQSKSLAYHDSSPQNNINLGNKWTDTEHKQRLYN